MYCSKCGAAISEGTSFCGACGQRVPNFSGDDPASAPLPSLSPVTQTPPGYAAAPGPSITPQLYAGFWLRVVAYIIDAIVLALIGMVLMFPFGAAMGLHGMFFHPMLTPADMMPMMGTLLLMTLLRSVASWLYYALFESSAWQATLGKKALGLEVTDLAGKRVSFGRATGRFFGMIVSALILCIGFLMAGFTEKKQALHDMMAGCLVIRKT